MKHTYQAILVAVVLAVSGCGTSRGVSDLNSATGFFVELLCENQIPQVRKEDHGQFFTTFDPPGFSSGYPMTVNAYLTPKGQKQERVYLMKKETPSSPWLITGAWTKDENGNKVQVPIPTSDDQLKASGYLSNVIKAYKDYVQKKYPETVITKSQNWQRTVKNQRPINILDIISYESWKETYIPNPSLHPTFTRRAAGKSG